MQSRILTAYTLENLEKNALDRIGRGQDPPRAEVECSNGFLGLKNFHTERQNSHNGCWSCAYSLLLKGRVPTPLMTHMVVSKTLQYISDKYTVRDTKSGAERFGHAMEILRVTMPEDKYRQLLADINKARKAAPGSKHYIDYDTYKPANWTDPKPKQTEAEQAQIKGPVPQPF